MPEEVGAPTKPHQGGKGAIVGGAARLIRNEEEDDGEIGGCLAGAGTAQEECLEDGICRKVGDAANEPNLNGFRVGLTGCGSSMPQV